MGYKRTSYALLQLICRGAIDEILELTDCIDRNAILFFRKGVSSMRRNYLLALSLLSLTSIALSACGNNAVDNSKLVIGMECAYQPFNWTVSSSNEFTLPIDGTNEFADGYDIAIARYLSKDLNKDVVIKRIEWDDLIPSLNNGAINMVLAGMSSTAERRQTIDFTEPYLKSDLAFLMRSENIPIGHSKNNPLNYSQLKTLFSGHSLVCQANVVGDDIIETYFASDKSLNISHSAPQQTYPLDALDVQRGISFAMPAELPVVEAMANLDGLGVLYCDYSFLSAGDLEGLSVNIGLKKGNSELLEQLNASLAKLSQDERGRLMGEASQRSQA